jgi:hypothetical protein
MTKKVVILQSNYIPWKGYFDLINDADLFIFYDEVKYTKNDWRNRNKIYTTNGMQWLSIPIAKDAVNHKISDVRITDMHWQDIHYKSLSLGYKKTPFFNQLEEIIQTVYLETKWDYLSVLNQSLIKKISTLLNIKTQFVDSKNYTLHGDRVERLINLLNQVGATEYISGPSAKDYLSGNEHLFADNDIKLTYKEYPKYPDYKQLSQPFRNDVSIFDMITNIQVDEIKNYIWDIKNNNHEK